MLRSISGYFLIIAVSVIAGVGITIVNGQRYLAEQRLQVTQISASIASEITQSLNEKVLITKGIAAVFEAEPDLPADRFAQIAKKMVQEAEDIINVAAAPDLVFKYVFPLEQNQAVMGLDLRDRSDFMGGVDQAMLLGETLVDGPFELVQGGQGFITRSPVMYPSGTGASQGVWGVVSLVIDKNRFFSAVEDLHMSHGLDIVIETERGESLYGQSEVIEGDPVLTRVTAPGVSWTVSSVPRGGWPKTPPNFNLLWGLVALAAIVAILVKRSFDWLFARSVRAETQLMEAIEALDDGFALYDCDDRLILCNNRYKEMYPASADAMIPGRRFEDIVRYGLARGQFNAALGDEEAWLSKRLELHRTAGRPMEQGLNDGRWLRVVERRTPSGNTVGFRVDITELKAALAKAEKASAAKTEFLNTISHELRTPLTVVLGYNAFLRKPETLPTYMALAKTVDAESNVALSQALDAYQADIDRFAMQIDVSGQQLMGLIGGILDLAAIEEGTLRLKREVVNLRKLCDEVAAEMRPFADKKGLELTVSGDAGKVFADPLRLKQIASNLIVNAIKFTDRGEISVHLGKDGSKAWVEVRDSGRGIAAADLDRIFDRFAQLDASNTRDNGGVGLGLPISSELAVLHGGRVTVQSIEGKGSVFRLELSHAQAETEAA